MTSARSWPAALCALVSLAAPAAARADTLTDINALRARHGLRGLAAATDPRLAGLVAQAAGNPANQRGARRPGFFPAVMDCRCSLPDAEYLTASQEWTELTGSPSGAVAFTGLYASELADLPALAPGVQALLLDPRATELASASDPSGLLVLAVQVDRAAPWRAPLLAGPGPVDPSRPLELVRGPGRGVSVRVRSHGGWRDVKPVDTRDTLAPTGAVATSLSAELAWGARYRVRWHGGARLEFRTAAVPVAIQRRGVRYLQSIDAHGRRVVQAARRATRPAARRLLALLDGLVRVGMHHHGVQGSYSGLMLISMWDRQLRAPPSTSRWIVVHEFGHLVDEAMLDPSAAARLDRLIPAGGGCGHDACDLRSERFASTFAKWALRDPTVGGYGVPAPRDLDAWGRALLAGVHLRPVGPRAPGDPFQSAPPG